MRIGITGHQRLKNSAAWAQVRTQITNTINLAHKPIIGISSLAIGADQMFAEIVLHLQGELEVIIPFKGYELKFEDELGREAYHRLLGQATRVKTLKKHGSDEEAYFEAGRIIADSCDEMIAVWDGQPAVGLGGTADVVDYCKSHGKPIVIIHV